MNFVESAVAVAEIVVVTAPVPAGVNVIDVPDFTPAVALSVPADIGLTDRFTVFENAPVPVTVGVQAVVCTSVIEDGLQATDTLVIVGAGTAVIVIAAVPDLLGSALEVALIVSEPEAGTFEGAAYNPALDMVPEVAVHETSELKLPVPVTVAAHWLVWLVCRLGAAHDAETDVIVGTGGLVVTPPVTPPQPASQKLPRIKRHGTFIFLIANFPSHPSRFPVTGAIRPQPRGQAHLS